MLPDEAGEKVFEPVLAWRVGRDIRWLLTVRGRPLPWWRSGTGPPSIRCPGSQGRPDRQIGTESHGGL